MDILKEERYEKYLRDYFISLRGTPQCNIWLDYAKNAPLRGEKLCEYLYKRNILSERTVMLDLGCGMGGFSLPFAKKIHYLYCVDVNKMSTKMTKARFSDHNLLDKTKVILYQGDSLPFVTDKFDFILLNDVLEHVKYQGEFMRETVRVLKPGGYIYLKVYNRLACNPKEVHYGIIALHWMPKILANYAMQKKFSREYFYDVCPITIWQLKRLLQNLNLEFEINPKDAIIETSNERTVNLKKLLISLGLWTYFCTTIVAICKKKNRG